MLATGADACAEDTRGDTALMRAIFKGELAECNPDQRNAANQTPAIYAALFQRETVLDATDPLDNAVESLARGEIRTAPVTQ